METIELLKLIDSYQYDLPYVGDKREYTLKALKELVDLREKLDEVKDVLK